MNLKIRYNNLKKKDALRLGFLPVVDCAPLVVAHELGIFKNYGLNIELKRLKNWTAVRDQIVNRQIEAAHAPATLPIVMSLGLNSELCACVTGLFLSSGGNAITLSRDLWERGLHRPSTLFREVKRRKQKLSFGIPCPGSQQEFLLRRWLMTSGIDPSVDVRIVVIPSADMFPTLKLGYIDGYCVEEPWTSVAVQAGEGMCVATSSYLAPFHPEKALVVRDDFATDRAEEHERLIAALLEACEFCDRAWNRKPVAALLAGPGYVNAAKECLAPALVGPFNTWDDRSKHPMGLSTFHRFRANEPDNGKVMWLVDQLSQFPPGGFRLIPRHLAAFAKNVFLPDAFRRGAELMKANTGAKTRRPANPSVQAVRMVA